MPPLVRLRLPDGQDTTLAPGDLIGRNPRAALVVDDAAVSEAHALVSLREASLKLLALRGGFVLAPGEPPQTEVALAVGQSVWLSKDYRLDVEEVALPDAVLAVEGPGMARQVLAGVSSIVLDEAGRPTLHGRFRGGAAAVFWSVGEAWHVRVGDAASRAVGPGDRVEVGGVPLTLVQVALAGAGHRATVDAGSVHSPLRIVARYDTVHIHRDNAPVVVLTRTAARIISEMAIVGAPVHWESVAQEVWSRDLDAFTLRGRWDVSIQRLRRRLATAGIRSDLIATDGAGTVELVLYAGDRVEDAT